MEEVNFDGIALTGEEEYTSRLSTNATGTIDKEAGNHVFVEVSKDGTRLNIETLIGKKISEIQK